ncbi:hypothetical protein Q3G72_007932 [Acer saccharum]|nr:hypothetical protein Q3G72_007932 [Acer saccharum]
MVSELHERSKSIHMATSTLGTKNTSEPELSLQVLHQCSSLISLKLDSFNYLLWRSQMEPLIQSIDMAHHLVEGSEPTKEIMRDDGKTEPNPNYILWAKNDGLLTTWLMRNIETEVLISLENITSAHKVWKSIEEQILPTTVEKEMILNDTLMSLKKGSLSLDEYLKKFKSLCDSLAAIKKPIDDTRKVFQLARAYEQMLNSNMEEQGNMPHHDQAFVSQRGRGWGRSGGRFSS